MHPDPILLLFYGAVIFGVFALLAFVAEALDRRDQRAAHRLRRDLVGLARDARAPEDAAYAQVRAERTV